MSSILAPRKDLIDCSPSTQRMASVTLLLPLPFGPTTAVTPGTKSTLTRSANDLNPTLSKRFKYIVHSPISTSSVRTLSLQFYHKLYDNRSNLGLCIIQNGTVLLLCITYIKKHTYYRLPFNHKKIE